MQHSIVPVVAALLVSAALPVYNAVRPTVSVGGAYGLMASVDVPQPPPPSDECDCGCNGTGVVGDGRIEMDCGCESTCDCKKGKEAPEVCTSGSCGPAKTTYNRRPIFGRLFR